MLGEHSRNEPIFYYIQMEELVSERSSSQIDRQAHRSKFRSRQGKAIGFITVNVQSNEIRGWLGVLVTESDLVRDYVGTG